MRRTSRERHRIVFHYRVIAPATIVDVNGGPIGVVGGADTLLNVAAADLTAGDMVIG